MRSEAEILESVAAEHSAVRGMLILPQDIAGPGRFKDYVAARDEAAYVIRLEHGLSYQEIGRRLGERDHSSVRYGIAKYCRTRGLPVPACRYYRDAPTRVSTDA